MARQTRRRSPPTAELLPASIQGALIGIEPDGVVGWARDMQHPDAPVQVRLAANGQVVAEAVANQFDDERVRTLVGPGIAGFITRLTVAPAAPYPLHLSLHDASGAMLGLPLVVNTESELARLIGLTPTLSFDGSLDGVFEGALKGWARDTEDPDARIEVELLDAGRVVGRVVADQLREDLRQAGLHHGLYGYTFDLPVALLDGKAHSLTVRVAETAAVLRGGPIAFGPLATSALMTQLGALQSEVAALRMLVDALVSPTGTAQRRIMRVLSERLTAQAEIWREQVERGRV